MFHLKHMIENGMQKICIKTVDSDVIVILVGLFYQIGAKVDDVWIEYGAGKYMQYISIRTMYNRLGESRAKALLFFSCIHWFRHHICIPQQGQKNSLEYLEGIWWSNRNICESGGWTISVCWGWFKRGRNTWKVYYIYGLCHANPTWTGWNSSNLHVWILNKTICHHVAYLFLHMNPYLDFLK